MHSQRGFSLLAVMIAALLLAGLMVLVGQMMSSTVKSEANLEGGGELAKQMETLKVALASRPNCRGSFAGKLVDVTNEGYQTTASFAPDQMVLGMYDVDGALITSLIKVGDKLGPITVKSVQVLLDGKLDAAYLGKITVTGEQRDILPFVHNLSLLFETEPTDPMTPNLLRITGCKVGPK